MDDNRKILFFDGVCNLCNATVDFIIRNNKKSDIYFSSLQSDFAKEFLSQHNLSLEEISTLYYYEDGIVYKKSDGALRLYNHCRGPYKWISYFSFLPKTFRDGIYDWLARNRYRLLGKSDSCRITSESEKARFIE